MILNRIVFQIAEWFGSRTTNHWIRKWSGVWIARSHNDPSVEIAPGRGFLLRDDCFVEETLWFYVQKLKFFWAPTGMRHPGPQCLGLSPQDSKNFDLKSPGSEKTPPTPPHPLQNLYSGNSQDWNPMHTPSHRPYPPLPNRPFPPYSLWPFPPSKSQIDHSPRYGGGMVAPIPPGTLAPIMRFNLVPGCPSPSKRVASLGLEVLEDEKLIPTQPVAVTQTKSHPNIAIMFLVFVPWVFSFAQRWILNDVGSLLALDLRLGFFDGGFGLAVMSCNGFHPYGGPLGS